ncbi:hypothetical protein PC128_g27252, partial [Phytophthora cactorum]
MHSKSIAKLGLCVAASILQATDARLTARDKDTTKSTESSAYSYGKDDYGHDDYSHDDYGYDAYAYEHDDYKSSDYKVDDYEHKGYGGGYSYGYKTYGSDCDDYSDD